MSLATNIVSNKQGETTGRACYCHVNAVLQGQLSSDPDANADADEWCKRTRLVLKLKQTSAFFDAHSYCRVNYSCVFKCCVSVSTAK